ncbi:hypothetical protein KY285_003098, partial [Solanum tuberosum]
RDSANEYTDDGDVSWKVRRAAAKCLAALVVTQPEMLSKLYKQACSKLIDRFKERKSKRELEPGQYNAEIKRQEQRIEGYQYNENYREGALFFFVDLQYHVPPAPSSNSTSMATMFSISIPSLCNFFNLGQSSFSA